MEKPGLIISKSRIEKHFNRGFNKLKKMFGDDWYLYQYYTTYYLVVGDCETGFVSMKFDFENVVDGIKFGILCGKHSK